MIDRILGLVPSWLYAIVVATLATLVGVQQLRISAMQVEAGRVQVAHARALQAASDEAEKERRRAVAAQHEVQEHANTIRETNLAAARAARGDVAKAVADARQLAARVVGGGLRATAGRGAETGGQTTATAADSESAAETARVLAELYGWALARLEVVGEFADRSWLAAYECQRTYEVTDDAR